MFVNLTLEVSPQKGVAPSQIWQARGLCMNVTKPEDQTPGEDFTQSCYRIICSLGGGTILLKLVPNSFVEVVVQEIK